MLDELGSYALSDFLLFSQETYFRTFELYNQTYWPLHLVMAAAGGFVLYALYFRHEAGLHRIAFGLLAALWAWVGWAFHLERYATIHLAAPYFAALFAVGAVVILLAGLVQPRSRRTDTPSIREVGVSTAGAVLLAYAILLHPLSGLLAGRAWTELSLFGMGPDPTVIGTMGAALMLAGRRRWLILAVAVAWCLISTLTAYALGSIEAVAPAVIAAAAVALSWRRQRA